MRGVVEWADEEAGCGLLIAAPGVDFFVAWRWLVLEPIAGTLLAAVDVPEDGEGDEDG